MFCDACGADIRGEQRFCSACGKGVAPTTFAAFEASRVSRHVHLLSVLWLAYGMLALIGAFVVGIVARVMFGMGGRMAEHPEVPTAFVHSILTLVSIFVFCKAALAITTGFGLLNRQAWARTISIVVSVIAMLNIPFGMALGIYTLWVMMSPSSEEEYRRIATQQ